jgi:DNA-binding NtrC family response regulator
MAYRVRQEKLSSGFNPNGSDRSIPVDVRNTRLQCVVLMESREEFQSLAHLLGPAIAMHQALTLAQARGQLAATGARVLLTDVAFDGRTWEDALTMLAGYPRVVALLVTGPRLDERSWIYALERGAYDVIPQPFETREVERILQNARAHAGTSRAQRRAGAA